MKRVSGRVLFWAGGALIALSLACAAVVTLCNVPVADRFRRIWEALTVLLGCGCFAAAATRRTFAGRSRNVSHSIYALKLTGCIFLWFLIIQVTLRCFS